MGTGEPEAPRTVGSPMQLTADERTAFEVVVGICRASGLDMDAVPRSVHRPYLAVELVGQHAEEAFGRHGRALDALQFIVNLAIARQSPGGTRVVIDAGGYRSRREEILRQLALQYAAQVAERQEECVLDPLPAHERRVIHWALKDREDVTTYSEGDGPERRIIIAPK
ncbi:MAG TPA: R3H domain-containing nucleic acid-binding protein [Chthonomonadales bacterium]|nr:R3H domain-containing nucleic acid-binding protein [Chthonomonadales bacterium]